MNLDTPLKQVSGIGETFALRLEKLNLLTVSDLINHYPFRYDDFSNLSSALDAQVGEKVSLQGEIWSIKTIYTRSRKVITQAIFNDGTTPITLTWFNSPWLNNQIKTGDRLQVSGKLNKYKGKLSIMAPIWKVSSELADQRISELEKQADHTLIPVYPETFALSSKWLTTKINKLLPHMQPFIIDSLPEQIRNNMLPLYEALEKIHFPKNWQDVEQSRERLGFDELFFIQLATIYARTQWKEKASVEKFKVQSEKLKVFQKSLPFKLTSSQQKVIQEILDDLQKGVPMNRLVQGEVGSGKTIVAAAIAYITHLNGFKTLYMAPTEILAFQHQETLTHFLEPFGITVGIYTGSKKQVHRGSTSKAQSMPGASEVEPLLSDIIVGTHALLSEKLIADNIGLIIVDEQQRFGVEQRALLRSKAKIPHFLTMTATPIPRTVALTLYGDLDLSIIDQLPAGRKQVKTYVVPGRKRADSYQFIRKHIQKGSQVYIITPLIDFSETMQSVKAAKIEFEKLSRDIFPDLKLGLLHGQLKSKEKEEVINKFKSGETHILVSTSVVEVGVDVKNATIMVIEGAERFGLSQLHQLRGRVGRGEKESFCLLFSEDTNAISRLKNLETTSDGLKLAELDLKIRGSGEIFGTKQSGRFELKIASFSDLSLIEKTREAAKNLLQDDPTLDKYPLLKAKLASSGSNVMPD